MIRWFAQERASSCVAACVRMVLTVWGKEYSEGEIRLLLGNPLFGVTLQQAAHRLVAAGAIAQWHGDWGLDDLRHCSRDGNFPIVGLERHFFGHPSAAHAVVVTAVSSQSVTLFDPLSAKPQTSHNETFLAAWHSTGQETLLVLSQPS